MDQRNVSVLSWEPDESPVSVVELILGQHRLDDIEMHRAIGRRIAETGRNEPVDKVVHDARQGESWAIDLIQTVELPAPDDRLAMPVQDFGDSRVSMVVESVLQRLWPKRRQPA